MRKSRILFILHTPPPIHGSSMVGQFVKESKVINDAFNCRFVNLGTSRIMDEFGKNHLRKFGRYFLILCNVVVKLLIFRPQICYLAIAAKEGAFYKDSIVALLVKTFNVKMIYHFHNKGVIKHQHRQFDNILYKKVFENSEAILLSRHLYYDIQKYFTEDRVHFCPNGIPNSNYVINTVRKAVNEIPEILFLSNLIESKGIFVLLEACSILQERNIPFHCTFVGGEGDITAKQLLNVIQKLDLQNHINYAGRKYGEKKDEFLAKADIFAFPTYYHNETFGLVNLEAMQYSIPIVSTFEGGIPDVVIDGVTGFLVPQKDAKSLAYKLELLINNPELRVKMGRSGRDLFLKRFTLDIFEENLMKILSIMSQKVSKSTD